jgi:hypothetical protein
MNNSRCGRAVLFFSALGLVLMVMGAPVETFAQIFSQDLTMRSTTTSSGMMGRGAGTTTSTDYLSKNAMKMSSSDGSDTIIRFDAEKFITVDNKKKTYSEMTFKQLRDSLSKMGDAMKVDPKAMEAMKQIMGSMADSFAVTKEGPGENIAGYASEKYRITGPMEMEIWAASSLKIPAAYYDVMKLQVQSNPMFDLGKLYEEMKKIDGISLKTVMTIKMMNMEMKTTKVVTSVEKGAVPDSVFEVPAGYKLVNAR